MPNITVEGPPIKNLDKKRELVKEMTEAASKAYGLPKDIMVVGQQPDRRGDEEARDPGT